MFSLLIPAEIKLPWTDPMTSVSPIVRAILEQPAQYAGQTIPGGSHRVPMQAWGPS